MRSSLVPSCSSRAPTRHSNARRGGRVGEEAAGEPLDFREVREIGLAIPMQYFPELVIERFARAKRWLNPESSATDVELYV